MNATRKIKPPRVFISYSHDSPEHKAWVRELAIFLRQHGFDARLDQWEFDRPPDGWPAWYSRQIVAADYILMICNETYYKKFHGLGTDDFGRGVRWEGRAIQNLAYFDYLKAGCLAIVADEKDLHFVPTPLNDCTTCCLTCQRDKPWSESEVLQRLPCGSDRYLPIPSPPDDSSATNPLDDLPQDASIITSDVFQAIHQIDERIRLFSDEWRQQFVPIEFRENLDERERELPSGAPSIDDLRYNRQWLRYIPPIKAEQALEEFLHDPAPFLWWGIVAPGGVGKSRLAQELVLKLRKEHGWDAGFLSGDSGTEWLTSKSAGWRPRRPSLLIVDYAASRGPALVTAICYLGANLSPDDDQLETGKNCFPKTRLLFLDRPAQTMPVFAHIWDDHKEYDRQREFVRRFLWASVDVLASGRETIATDGNSFQPPATIKGLEPLVTDAELLQLENPQPDEWPEILAQVIKKSGGDPTLVPRPENTDFWNRVARLTGDGRLLFLQLLGGCLATRPNFFQELSRDDGLEKLLDIMIDRERDFRWKDLMGPSATDEDLRKIVRALGFITLTRGVLVPIDAENVMQASGATPQLLNDVLPRIVSVRNVDLSESDGAKQGQVFSPVEPDLLGERLLIRLASETGSGFALQPAEVSPDSFLPRALLCDSLGTAGTLSLLTHDFPQHPTTVRWLAVMLEHFNFNANDFQCATCSSQIAAMIGKMALKNPSMSKPLAQQLLEIARRNISNSLRSLLPPLVLQLSEAAVEANSDTWNELVFELAKVVKTVGHLEELESIPRVSVNAIALYGGAEKFDWVARWGKLLQELAKDDPQNSEIQLSMALGAFNAAKFFGEAGRFSDMEYWGRLLQDVARDNPQTTNIQLELAYGCINAISFYGKAEQFVDLERWGKLLQGVAKDSSQLTVIKLGLAQGAVNAIKNYGKAKRFADMERWCELLQHVASENPQSVEIQLMLAFGAGSAITSYGRARQHDDLERWGRLLQNIAQENPLCNEIQLELAWGTYNACFAYAVNRQFAEMERWGRLLQHLAKENTQTWEIYSRLANVADIAIITYGMAGQFVDMERWGKLLADVLPRIPIDAKRMESMLQNAVKLVRDEHVRAAHTQFQILSGYWPGFLCTLSGQNRVPLCLAIADILSENEREFDKMNIERCRGLMKTLLSQEWVNETDFIETLSELWPLRMYMFDRGDNLVPLLQQLKMEKELEEAYADPWRLGLKS